MVLSLIASVGRDGAIGRGGGLLWLEKADQVHFRNTTMGAVVVMGRKTWQSLPEKFRPLPGRRNIVVTRDAHFVALGAEVAPGLAQALALAQGEAKVFVIGGAPLFALALPLADELVLTEIDAEFADADTHFPAWNRADFEQRSSTPGVSSTGVPYAIVSYRRRQPA
jgi:dihydrofolate reductase